MVKYDFIILGAGAAGLSLLLRMIKSSEFRDKKILLVDRERKIKNDRTWCFWEKGDGFFEDIVSRRWHELSFYSDSYSTDLDIRPYVYKMIRGIDFYNYCFDIIKTQQNIEVKYGHVRSVVNSQNLTTIFFEGEELHCGGATIFNSLYNPANPVQGEIQLLQHFKGWFIESEENIFNRGKGILMDFRVGQESGLSFVYTLPITDKSALVEYTQFSEQTLKAEQYDIALKDYLKRVLNLEQFSITGHEFGIIPMTTKKFPFLKDGMYYIGTAGGQTKPSTGYTFQFIQKQSKSIVDSLIGHRPLSELCSRLNRFRFYDSVLLRLLKDRKTSGSEIFTRLFEKNKAYRIFKFLDNETSFIEELRLISSLQILPFLSAALRVT